MATAIDKMFFRPMTPDNADILMSGDLRAGDGLPTLEPRNQHLTCFAGGMLGLGGKLFSNANHVAIGKKLTDGCIWAYQAMPWNIMPEIAHFVP
jgi:mannosyl-oligosaccharide alpha-1,2-mannosidase